MVSASLPSRLKCTLNGPTTLQASVGVSPEGVLRLYYYKEANSKQQPHFSGFLGLLGCSFFMIF